ncbi:ATP-binding protein [Fodinicurvata fenggangensis]|uniref:ATP-binding protein n=1 Tax=Fodinicurvata fenggangensis TaxID=1121830 RepID=UPI00068E15E8|nr:ATP-binding protein [Fodinicurvata fenggangensis]
MKRAIILANILVALILSALLALQAIEEHDGIIEVAFRDAENLSDALAEQTSQTLNGIDLALTTIDAAISGAWRDGEDWPENLHELLVNRQQASSVSLAYFVLDGEGRAVGSSRSPDPGAADLSEYPVFKHHHDNPGSGLFIAPPRKGEVGHAANQWLTNVSRPIRTSDGSLAGVVAAAVSLDYLLGFYNALRIGDEGVVGLMNAHGRIILRSPFDEETVGTDLSESDLYREVLSKAESGRFERLWPGEDILRYTAFRQVIHEPTGEERALVYVGLGRDEVLAPWYDHMVFTGLLALLGMGLFIAVSALFWRNLVRRQQWEADRSERLRVLAQESAALGQYGDVKGLLQHVTDVASRLTSAHQALASLTRDTTYAQAEMAVTLSDKYAAWRDYDEPSDGSGIYHLVCENNQAMMLTQKELEAHPDWKGFGYSKDKHPPMRGWLAVPILAQDGSNLGLIHLSDKATGEFTEDDLNEMKQLASITGAALENLLSLQARDEALAEANTAREEVETIFNSISDAVQAFDHDWRFVYLNRQCEILLGQSQDYYQGKVLWEEFPDVIGTDLDHEYHRAVEEQTAVSFNFYYPAMGSWFAIRAYPHAKGLTTYLRDITQQVETEERLRQAQKMDAIGQLTGGIAHDFNNLLTVILGNSDVLVEELSDADEGPRLRAETILKAGERASELTHRLLAFARRQPLDPRPTDLNQLVTGMGEMLRRTLGEEIDIELVRGSGLWKAVVDPNELENAVLNLAINARDAMPEGGRLTIETANIAVDDSYAADNELQPGQYVMLAVSDTGRGMSLDVQQKAFEPFFTTKQKGKGSGLGLSMVYGFARQTGGQVRIYSEPDAGSAIRLYIPRAEEDTDVREAPAASSPLQSGTEHILVVEDDELVRRHTVTSLLNLGYDVTECANGAAALTYFDAGERFDLLLTDVMLPGGMTGKQVADEAVKRAPGLKVLFMSGYTENAIVHHGRLDPGVQLLSKPFRMADLARKVRGVLDKPSEQPEQD